VGFGCPPRSQGTVRISDPAQGRVRWKVVDEVHQFPGADRVVAPEGLREVEAVVANEVGFDRPEVPVEDYSEACDSPGVTP
jgi:hypothetical protein